MEYCVFVEPQQGASYGDLLAVAQAAERLGFHGLFRSDHYLAIGAAAQTLPGPSDAWTTLAALARDTQWLRLGTLVSSVTFRHPGILAMQVANVDDMSGGRAELGLGTGWYAQEHAAYGIPFPAKRFGLLEEQLAIITGMWATPAGTPFTFSGKHYSLADSPALPKPVQHQLPVIVGGAGASRTPQLAARYATEYNIFRGPVTAKEKFDGVRAAAERQGRDPDSLKYSTAVQVITGASDAEIDTRIRAIGQDPATARAGRETAVGSVQKVIDHLAAYHDIGASRVYLQLFDLQDLEHLEFIGTEVLPKLPH